MLRKHLLLPALFGSLAALAGCGGSGETESAAPTAAATAAPAPVAEAAPETPSEPAVRPLLEQELAYGEGRTSNLEGFLAMPGDAAEPLPGVIVIHESRGLTADAKAAARRLAREGYVALAVDLYGGRTADTAEGAQALMSELFGDPDAARGNLRQAYDYLDKYAFAPRIAAVGFDLGAGWALQTALAMPEDLDAVVMYYGQVTTNREDLAALKTPLLGFFGAADASVPVRQVQEFRSLLMELGKNAEVLIVSGADHGFASPSARGYDEQQAEEAWGATLAFLQRQLKLSTPTR
jgi:carboxymethylenebutenolidase